MGLVGTRAGKLQRPRKWGRDAFALSLRIIFTIIGMFAWAAARRRTEAERGASPRATTRGAGADDPKKILLIRLDLLGDLVLTMPAVAAVRRRYPDARISMLVLPYTAPVLELFPYVDEVLTFDINKLRPSGDMLNPVHYRDLWRLLLRLRRRRYDLCVSFYGLYAGLFSFLSGARQRVGYRCEGCPFLFTVPLAGERYLKPEHEARYDMALSVAAGAVDTGEPVRPVIPPAATERVSELLAAEGIGPRDLVIAFHPGSANGTAKRWLDSGWASLADRLAQGLGARVVLTGVASELPLVRSIAGMASSNPAVLAGKTSVAEAAALLMRCSVLVSGDSAPVHMACALGTPVVALHGPTDPAITGPYGGRSVVVWKRPPCSPCYDLSDTAECKKKTLACMESISPEEVCTAVETLLETADSGAAGAGPGKGRLSEGWARGAGD